MRDSDSQLVLGTAQWGNTYGITNAIGRISDEECAAIVDAAREAGITSIDTAAGYGDAQARLQPWAADFRLTTKISGSDPASVLHLVEASLMELGVEQVEGLLIHDWEALNAQTQAQVVDELGVVVERGLAASVGVSIYEDCGIDSAVGAFAQAGMRLGVMQVPANPLDQRLNDSGALMSLHNAGTRIQIRSVFLQGLLAGPAHAQLASHSDVVRFHRRVAERELNPIVVCLSHVRSLPWANEIGVGVTSADELRAIVDAWTDSAPMQTPLDLASEDLDLIDPRRW